MCKKFFNDLQENVLEIGEDLLDAGINIGTGGIVGYKDGKLRKGVATRITESSLKDVTGATAAEEANKDARAQFEEQKKAAADQRSESQAKFAQDQIRKSKLAGGSKAGGRATTAGAKKSFLGSDEQDFLGL